MLEKKVLSAYADGSPIGVIIESFNITHKKVVEILQGYRDESRLKKSFTDEFKKFIAERDSSGDITRSSIAQELGINANTVKKACEQFGQSSKERAVSNQAYTRIDGKFDMKSCPSCKSKRVNIVDDSTAYCKKCGSEHIHKEDHVLKVNFEYLEE